MSSLLSCRKSMVKLRQEGYLVAKVEFWNAAANKRQDLWGFADIIAIRPRTDCRGEDRMLVQSCANDLAAHEQKLRAEPRVLVALRSGFRVVIHAWVKRKCGRVLVVSEMTDSERRSSVQA